MRALQACCWCRVSLLRQLQKQVVAGIGLFPATALQPHMQAPAALHGQQVQLLVLC